MTDWRQDAINSPMADAVRASAEIPQILYCRHCRTHRTMTELKSIGVRFAKPGYWATYRLECGHTAETPHR